MKASELIKQLETFITHHGDQKLYKEVDDGRSTWAESVNFDISYREIWKGHSAGKRWFIS